MTTYNVSGGQTDVGFVLSSGDVMNILSGGTASNTIVRNGGTENVLSGGSAINTVLSAGAVEYVVSNAIDNGTVISSGGVLFATQIGNGPTTANARSDIVLSGGIAVASSGGWIDTATIRGGSVSVGAGGFTQNDVVSAGGIVRVLSGGSANLTTVSSGGLDTVSAGGVDSATFISYGGVKRVLGSAYHDRVLSGGIEIVSSGGTAIGVVVSSGGSEIVSAGGTVVISGFVTQPVYGVTASGGMVIVSSGGTTSGAVLVNGGTEVLSTGAIASGTNINAGGILSLTSGAWETGALVASGGTLTTNQIGALAWGADAYLDTVLSGGTAIAGSQGWIQSATVQGGTVIVSSGGFTQADTVSSGGTVMVRAGGSANLVTVGNGGFLFNWDVGANTSQTQISSGGQEYVYGTTSHDHVFSGGRIIVYGGTTSGAVVDSGGTEDVAYGGTAIVLAAQTAYGLYAEGSSTVLVNSGGTAANPFITLGTLELASGAAVTGNISFFTWVGGTLRIDGTTMPGNTITGMVPSDKIDLPNIAFSATGTANLAAGYVLQIKENGSTYSLHLDPAQSFTGAAFAIADDGSGGTLVTEVTAADDFDGSGISEVLLSSTNGTFADWTTNGATLTAAQNVTFGGSTVALDPSWSVTGTGDFNADGRTDLLLHNSNGTYVDWTMNGSAISAAANLTFNGAAVGLDSSWWAPGIGAFYGTGNSDILLRNSNGSFVVWAMNGSQIDAANSVTFNFQPVAIDNSWQIQAVADLNGDGFSDILLRNTNGTFADWTMVDSSITAAQLLTFQGSQVALDPSWSVLGAGDFNGDGKADILLRNTNGTFADWTMSGSAITAAQLLTFQGSTVVLDSSWTFADIGDYNGDGRADILLRGSSGSFVDWTMSGSAITGAANLTFQGNPVLIDNSWHTVTS